MSNVDKRHEEDFGCTGKWNFHATSHGKEPCDGIGGIVKRAAAKANLQNSYDNQITHPREMFQWAKLNFKVIHVEFCSSE